MNECVALRAEEAFCYAPVADATGRDVSASGLWNLVGLLVR